MASRATQNANIDAAMATVVANVPTWVANGGKASNFVRSILATLAATDPGMARWIERRVGSSLLVGVKTTITAADTSP